MSEQAAQRTGQQAKDDLDDHKDDHKAQDAAPLGVKGVEVSKPAADTAVEAKGQGETDDQGHPGRQFAHQAGAQATPGKQRHQDNDNDVVEVHAWCSSPAGLAPWAASVRCP